MWLILKTNMKLIYSWLPDSRKQASENKEKKVLYYFSVTVLFLWSLGCVLPQRDTELELIHLLFFTHLDSMLHARPNNKSRSNASEQENQMSWVFPKNSGRQTIERTQDQWSKGNIKCLVGMAKKPRLKSREFMKKMEEWRHGGKQGKSRKKGKSKKRGGRGNIVCLAVLSVHLSPPFHCLSRCLIVYYVKLKASGWCTHWFGIFRDPTAAVSCWKWIIFMLYTEEKCTCLDLLSTCSYRVCLKHGRTFST